MCRLSSRKRSIWANEYIDFGALLSSFPDDEKFILSFKFFSLGQWQSAFKTFVAVYTVKYPLKVTALLKYHIVKL